MPPAKRSKKIEVTLDQIDPKKSSVKFLTDSRPVAFSNLYLDKGAWAEIGSPEKIKVTIEPIA